MSGRPSRRTVSLGLSVGGDYLHATAVIERDGQRLRILRRVDCVRDRSAHYDHWNDYTALNAAVGVAASHVTDDELESIRFWTERESGDLLPKYAEFLARLQVARS